MRCETPIGTQTYRAYELEQAVHASLGPWTPWFRPAALPGLTMTVAVTAPELPFASQVVLAKLGAWICAFDDLVDHGALADDELALRIGQYQQLACYGCPEIAFDPIARLCAEVLDALVSAPLGQQLWQQLSAQLIATCAGMLGERQLLAQQRAGRRVSAEQYLHHGADSVAIGLATTAAAILIGEPRVVEQLGALRCAQRHAAIAVRLANDLATWTRERAEGSSANVLSFAGDEARSEIDARIDRELQSCAIAIRPLAALAPMTAAFVTRFAGVLVATYRRGDL
jgi:hypothetical protein